MATQVQNRRGTTAQHSTFTGAVGEVTIDTDKDTVVVHDGATAGGRPLLREDGSNSALALGSAGSPSLKWDANTGLYSPGADQVAISTNGTGRLFINSSGQVGVGTSSPGTVESWTPTGKYLHISDTTAAGLMVSSNFPRLVWNELDQGANAALFQANMSGGALQVSRINDDGSVKGTDVVIDSSGRLGVGTTSPTVPFHIGTIATNTYALFDDGTNARITFNGSTSTAGIYSTTTGFGAYEDLEIRAAATIFKRDGTNESARIDSSGRLGIGTSSPGVKLTISDTGTTPGLSTFNGGNSSAITSFAARAGLELIAYQSVSGSPYTKTSALIANSDGTVPSEMQFWTKTSGQSSPAERLRIDSSGRVGIGTTSPSQILSVGSTTGRIFAVNQGTANKTILDNDYALELRSNGGYQLIHNANNSLGSIAFQINSGEKARIDSSGRLLVGTSSDSGGALLQVNGDRIRVATSKTPASATDTGTAGEICWDANYIYVCTATNTWKRTAIATW